jgi:hypothetical protein
LKSLFEKIVDDLKYFQYCFGSADNCGTSEHLPSELKPERRPTHLPDLTHLHFTLYKTNWQMRDAALIAILTLKILFLQIFI